MFFAYIKSHLWIQASLVVMLFAFSSCVLVEKKQAGLSLDDIDKLQQAQQFSADKKFSKALKIYDELARKLQGRPEEAILLLESAALYRNKGACMRAVLRYRKALEVSLKNPAWKASALLGMSYSYECLGRLKFSYLSLQDLKLLKKELSIEKQNMIYPARLSIAHAWFSKKKEIQYYRSVAMTGFLNYQLLNSKHKNWKQKASEILYKMGQSYIDKKNLQKNLQKEAFVLAFSQHQFYLLQSLILNSGFWSVKSKEEIKVLFDHLAWILNQASSKERQTYKVSLQKALKEATDFLKKEASQKEMDFYKTQIQRIEKFFEKQNLNDAGL